MPPMDGGPVIELGGAPIDVGGAPIELRGAPIEFGGAPIEFGGPPIIFGGAPIELGGPPSELGGGIPPILPGAPIPPMELGKGGIPGADPWGPPAEEVGGCIMLGTEEGGPVCPAILDGGGMPGRGGIWPILLLLGGPKLEGGPGGPVLFGMPRGGPPMLMPAICKRE